MVRDRRAERTRCARHLRAVSRELGCPLQCCQYTQVFNWATMGEGGGGCKFGLRETWFDLREGCAKLF